MNRIDVVTMPNLEGKSIPEAIKALYDHCHDTAVQVMLLTNEVVALNQKVQKLEQNQR